MSPGLVFIEHNRWAHAHCSSVEIMSCSEPSLISAWQRPPSNISQYQFCAGSSQRPSVHRALDTIELLGCRAVDQLYGRCGPHCADMKQLISLVDVENPESHGLSLLRTQTTKSRLLIIHTGKSEINTKSRYSGGIKGKRARYAGTNKMSPIECFVSHIH